MESLTPSDVADHTVVSVIMICEEWSVIGSDIVDLYGIAAVVAFWKVVGVSVVSSLEDVEEAVVETILVEEDVDWVDCVVVAEIVGGDGDVVAGKTTWPLIWNIGMYNYFRQKYNKW